jgi:signal transduction histidine kinase
MLNLAFFELLFYYLFFIGDFNTSYSQVLRTGFPLPTGGVLLPDFLFTVLPFLIILSFQVVFLLFIKFGLSNPVEIIYELFLKKRQKVFRNNMRDILHSRKNILFSTKLLGIRILDNYGTETGKAALMELLDLCENNIQSVSKALNALRKIKTREKQDNLIDIIESAFKQITIPEYISIERKYHADVIPVRVDSFHLTNAFVNLFENAIEAIQLSGNKAGKIMVNTSLDGSWIKIEIADNGIGIEKKKMRKIEHPFFSEKAKHSHWGLGLSYVKKIIKLHMAYHWWERKENRYTSFNIIFPDLLRGSEDH